MPGLLSYSATTVTKRHSNDLTIWTVSTALLIAGIVLFIATVVAGFVLIFT